MVVLALLVVLVLVVVCAKSLCSIIFECFLFVSVRRNTRTAWPGDGERVVRVRRGWIWGRGGAGPAKQTWVSIGPNGKLLFLFC